MNPMDIIIRRIGDHDLSCFHTPSLDDAQLRITRARTIIHAFISCVFRLILQNPVHSPNAVVVDRSSLPRQEHSGHDEQAGFLVKRIDSKRFRVWTPIVLAQPLRVAQEFL
jgi:hypothetical protein